MQNISGYCPNKTHPYYGKDIDPLYPCKKCEILVCGCCISTKKLCVMCIYDAKEGEEMEKCVQNMTCKNCKRKTIECVICHICEELICSCIYYSCVSFGKNLYVDVNVNDLDTYVIMCIKCRSKNKMYEFKTSIFE